MALAQKNSNVITIEGIVADKETKEPLPFTNVIVQGTSIGTITNEEGIFELSFNKRYKNKKIIFSFIGYKNTAVPIKHFDEAGKMVFIEASTEALDEIVVNAKNKYKELVDKAISLIPVNYSQEPVFMETYYRELTKIDNNYTRFADAACSIQYSPYDDHFSFRQSQMNYMQFKRLEYDIKKVPYPEPRDMLADEKDLVKIIALRKSDNLQKYRILEQSEKLKAIDTANLKWLENSEIGGGPLKLTGADKIKRKADFFNPKENSKYLFQLYGKSSYDNKPVFVISFKPKNPKDFSAPYKGQITIDQISTAIISYTYEPTEWARKNMNQKFGVQLKTPKSVEEESKKVYISRTTELKNYKVLVSFFEYNSKWYLKRIRLDNEYHNSGDLFDPYNCNTETELIVNNVSPAENSIASSSQVFMSSFSNPLFGYAMEYDPMFWETYSTIIPRGIVDKALDDLESKTSLEEQFKEN